MATLSLINNFSLNSQGSIKTGKQGAIASAVEDTFDVTVTGTSHHVTGALATATVVTVYDDDNDFPIDWDYLFFWADVDMYIQIIGATTNVVFKALAKVPFTLTYDQILAAANTTLITGGTEPTMEDIDSIAIGNYSGGTGNYLFAVVD